MAEFTMPSLGADMEHGKVVEWLVEPGDNVHRGDIVAVVDTEKSDIDVESFEDGVVEECSSNSARGAGRHAARPDHGDARRRGERRTGGGTSRGVTGCEADACQPARADPARPLEPVRTPQPAREPPPPASRSRSDTPLRRSGISRTELGVDVERSRTGRRGATRGPTSRRAERASAVAQDAATRPCRPGRVVRSSPRARRLAAELGMDLVRGPRHRAGRRRHRGRRAVDAAEAVAKPRSPPVPAPPRHRRQPGAPTTERRPTAGRRRRTHRRPSAGGRRPDGAVEGDDPPLLPEHHDRPRRRHRLDAGASTPAAGRDAAGARCAAAQGRGDGRRGGARDQRILRATARSGRARPCTSGRGGPAAAAVVARRPSTMPTRWPWTSSWSGCATSSSRARAGRLQRAEMADPTITVTNLGDLGVETVFGVIYPPQVALIGFGRVVGAAVRGERSVGVRPAVTATLSADHRASDGLRGGRFLARDRRAAAESGGTVEPERTGQPGRRSVRRSARSRPTSTPQGSTRAPDCGRTSNSTRWTSCACSRPWRRPPASTSRRTRLSRRGDRHGADRLPRHHG